MDQSSPTTPVEGTVQHNENICKLFDRLLIGPLSPLSVLGYGQLTIEIRMQSLVSFFQLQSLEVKINELRNELTNQSDTK